MFSNHFLLLIASTAIFACKSRVKGSDPKDVISINQLQRFSAQRPQDVPRQCPLNRLLSVADYRDIAGMPSVRAVYWAKDEAGVTKIDFTPPSQVQNMRPYLRGTQWNQQQYGYCRTGTIPPESPQPSRPTAPAERDWVLCRMATYSSRDISLGGPSGLIVNFSPWKKLSYFCMSSENGREDAIREGESKLIYEKRKNYDTPSTWNVESLPTPICKKYDLLAQPSHMDLCRSLTNPSFLQLPDAY